MGLIVKLISCNLPTMSGNYDKQYAINHHCYFMNSVEMLLNYCTENVPNRQADACITY